MARKRAPQSPVEDPIADYGIDDGFPASIEDEYDDENNPLPVENHEPSSRGRRAVPTERQRSLRLRGGERGNSYLRLDARARR